MLTVDVVLRLSAIGLAVLIVVRALFAGATGLLAVVVVVAAAVALWASVRLYGRVRAALRRSDAGDSDWADGVAALLASRSRSRLAAVLALLILVVHAGMTGYVSVGTILIAVVLGAVATLLSPDLRLVLLLGGTAVVFAVATVFVANMFQGSTEARALAVSLAAVVLPVLVSDKLVKLVRQPRLTVTHHAILTVLTLLLGFLGWTRADWLPGVVHNCYTLPTSTGITVLRATPDGKRCYGLIDTADPGVFAARAFGRDPDTVAIEREILSHNGRLRDGDLTVIWLGALSCDPSPADATRCADGRDYPAERDQLRALLFAQAQFAAVRGGPRLHVVIADATQDVAHAADVADLIVDRQRALGSRRVVIGGGDSRDTTQLAINKILDAGIPFIAPNLLADLGAPGRPFVDRPGYLQLAYANKDYADHAVARLAKTFPQGFRLDIYEQVNPTDQYTTSLVNDLLSAVHDVQGATARHVSTLDKLDASACGTGPGTVLFFADRWTRFADFAQRLNDLCGHARPRMVIADGSVSRFMANYQLRAVSNADWPVDYYVGGPGCAALTADAFTKITTQMYAHRKLLKMAAGQTFTCADSAAGGVQRACTLDAAVKLTSQPCEPNDLGTFLVPAWDAVFLADKLLPHPGSGRDDLTSLELTDLRLATGAVATVHGGVLTEPTIPVQLRHVDHLNGPSQGRLVPEPTPKP